MTKSLACIHNVGEFYSQYYLDQELEHQLKDLLKAWAQAEEAGGPPAPHRRLQRLADGFFRRASSAYGDPRERLPAAQAFHAEFLEALGYCRQPELRALEGGELLPLVAALDYDRRPWLWIVEAPFGASEDDASPWQEAPQREQLRGLVPAMQALAADDRAAADGRAARDGNAATDGSADSLCARPWRDILDRGIFQGADHITESNLRNTSSRTPHLEAPTTGSPAFWVAPNAPLCIHQSSSAGHGTASPCNLAAHMRSSSVSRRGGNGLPLARSWHCFSVLSRNPSSNATRSSSHGMPARLLWRMQPVHIWRSCCASSRVT